MATLRRDGVELWYEEAGTGSPPLLLVHGWCGDHTHLAPQFEHFRATHRVVTVDRRGHGRSDKPEQPYTVAGFADDLAWLCDELGLHRPVVVVHSMDAIALDLAVRHPDLPAAIVLLDTATFRPPALGEAFQQLLLGLTTPGYREVITQLADNIVFAPTDDPDRKRAIVEQMTSLPQHVIVSTWAEYVAYDVEAAAAACRVPVLHVGAVFPCDIGRFREATPQLVAGHTVGSGHFITLEVPDQVNAMIERFLAVTVAQPAAAGSRSPASATSGIESVV